MRRLAFWQGALALGPVSVVDAPLSECRSRSGSVPELSAKQSGRDVERLEVSSLEVLTELLRVRSTRSEKGEPLAAIGRARSARTK